MAKCPFRPSQFSEMYSCYLAYALHDDEDGCLIAKALKTYIKVNSPITAYSEESEGRIRDRDTANLDYLMRLVEETHNDEYYDSWAGPVGYD